MFTTISIRKPVVRVFAFVTTLANWPWWHPSPLGVSGTVGHPLEVGEQVTEEFLVAGRRGRVVWTVREREALRRWVIDGQVIGREGGGTITYTLTHDGAGTRFEREFLDEPPGLLDLLLIRRVAAEPSEALRRLKECLESS